GVEAALNDPVALEALYREFADSGHQVDAFAALGRGCDWDAGRYALTLHVNTARPERTFSKRWEFDLTEADAHQLRLNSITVLRNMAELPSTYGFAYPQYDAF